MDQFQTIVIASDDYEKIVSCNTTLDESNENDYCVIAALSVKQCISLSQVHQPDCIIIDTSLANSDLLKTLAKLHADTPVVLIISEINHSDILQEAKSLGCNSSIDINDIANNGLHNIIQLVTKTLLNSDSNKVGHPPNRGHYNAYSYAEPKYLGKTPGAKPAPPSNGKKPAIDLANILMVEDNIYDIRLAEILLCEDDKLQFNLFTASNGEEALEFLRDNKRPRIDLILLDINMPIMNGFEFLEQHNNESAANPVPVIVCSTSSYPPDQARASKLGADGYIIKPANLEKMRVTISKLNHIEIKDYGNKRALQYVTQH